MRTDIFQRTRDFDIELIVPSEIELKKLKDFIEFNTQVNSINDYFQCVITSYNTIFDYFHFNSDGKFKVNTVSNTDEYIQINTLTVSFISFAKTFTEKIGNFFNKYPHLGRNFKRDYLSKEYDNNFSYMMLQNFRNFGHHNGLPVSVNLNYASFHLDSILNLDSTFNKNTKQQLTEKAKEIFDDFNDQSNYPYYLAIIDYYCSLLTIFKKYSERANTEIDTRYRELKILVSRNEKLLIGRNEMFYEIGFREEEQAHLIVVLNQHPLKETINEVNKILKEKKKLLSSIKESVIYY